MHPHNVDGALYHILYYHKSYAWKRCLALNDFTRTLKFLLGFSIFFNLFSWINWDLFSNCERFIRDKSSVEISETVHHFKWCAQYTFFDKDTDFFIIENQTDDGIDFWSNWTKKFNKIWKIICKKLSSSKSKNISNVYFSIKFSFPKLEIENLLSKLDVLKIFYLVNKFIRSPGKKLTRGVKPKNLKRIWILRLKYTYHFVRDCMYSCYTLSCFNNFRRKTKKELVVMLTSSS